MEPHIFDSLRYIQLVDYPFQNFSKGVVISPSSNEKIDLNNYPETFRKLEWWEHRTIEEITTHLKFIEVTEESKNYWLPGDKLKVVGFDYDVTDSFNPKIRFLRATGRPHNDSTGLSFTLKKILPATELNISK